MPPSTKLRVGLIKCGNCGQRYSNPAAHVCRARSTRRRGRTKLAPKVSLQYTCPSCGKSASSPLTHVCTSKRGDFKRRKKAAAARERKARRDANRHDYQTCPQGESCERYPCRVYAEGRRDGYEDGHADGHSAGYDEGKADGLKEGQPAAKE